MIKVKYVVWHKQGYWYCANVNTMMTVCYSNLDEATCLEGMELIRHEGGAYFYG